MSKSKPKSATKFIDHFDHQDFKPTVTTEKFDKYGDPISDSDVKSFAEIINVDIGKGQNQRKYAIMTFNNVPYDPIGIDSHRESKLRLELKATSKETFEYYLLYLRSRNGLYFTRSQRSFING